MVNKNIPEKNEDNFISYANKLKYIIDQGEGLLTSTLSREQELQVTNLINKSRIKLLELEFNNLK